jgi:predicted RNase H-like HicB family nuclease
MQSRTGVRILTFAVELELEEDGRWIAEVVDLPGVLAYGASEAEAKAKVQALALRAVDDRLEHGEADPDLLTIPFAAA